MSFLVNDDDSIRKWEINIAITMGNPVAIIEGIFYYFTITKRDLLVFFVIFDILISSRVSCCFFHV